MRGRGNNGRKNSHSRSNSFESNGPEIKVRGNAQQVVEKYLTLAREASLADDRVRAENYFQHAEHYYRLMTANGGAEQRDQSALSPGQPEKPLPEITESSENATTSSEESGEQSAKAPIDENGADVQKPPVDDPASAPQPEIEESDSARPE